MIADAMKYLAGMATEASRPMPVEIHDPSKLAFLVGREIVEVPRPVPARVHTADDIDTLVSLANRWAVSEPVIWVNEDDAVLVLDDLSGHRVNTVTFALDWSEKFARVRELAETKPWLEQKAFIRLLRIELAGTLPPVMLLDRVRKLRFESGQVTTQESVKNRESMGRQVTAAASGDGEIPESVTLEVKVFRAGESFPVACSVDVDPSRGLLQLAPLPDEIDRVTRLAVASVADAIERAVDKSVKVYIGAP